MAAHRRIGAWFFLAFAAACTPLAPLPPTQPALITEPITEPTTEPTTEPSAAASPTPILTATDFAHLPGWRSDTHDRALIALRRSCARLGRLPAGRSLGAGGIAGTAADWAPVCAAADRTNTAAREFFETWFTPHAVTVGGTDTGLFTGYYEAALHGARTAHGRYQVPIYGRPPELVTVDLGRFKPRLKGQRTAGRVVGGHLEPFASRAGIAGGTLKGRGLELLWVDSAVDAFFLHIQGSGRVAMDDGTVVRLGYDGHNGHDYVAIGRELITSGAIAKDKMSMQSIRVWLSAHPRQGAALMARNPAFIFFRAVDGPGPIGSQGAALTPGRSLAVDKRFVPLGIPLWLDTTDPLDSRGPLRRLVVAQDTGGAIKGPVRGDLFWGFGAAAAKKAGAMRQQGRYFLLLPKRLRR